MADLCAPVFRFAFELKAAAADQRDPASHHKEVDHLGARCDELFNGMDHRAQQLGISQADVRQAKYALAAYLDELILLSGLPAAEGWAGRQLQLTYFNETAAGEEFYNKLETLRHTGDADQIHLLEVYYLCLALGFKGRYSFSEGLEKRKVLIDNLARELLSGQPAGDQALSPQVTAPDELPPLLKHYPLWVVPLACASTVTLIFLVLEYTIESLIGTL